jgi:hypothetical protein
MALATRAEWDEESYGFGGKSNGNEGGNNQWEMGACDEEGEGGKVMAMGIRVAGDEEGKGNEEGNVIGDEGGVQRREQSQWGWQAIDGNKGDGNDDGKDVANGNGEEAGGQRRGQGRERKGDGSSDEDDGRQKGNVTAARAMAMATRVADERQGWLQRGWWWQQKG